MDLLYLVFFPLFVLYVECLSYEDFFKNVNVSIAEQLSVSCKDNLEKITNSTNAFRRMKTSSGELTELKANHAAFMGHFEQCLTISGIQTKFCKVYLKATRKQLPFDFLKSFGQGTYICVLKSCTVDDLNFLAGDLLWFPEEECTDGTRLEFDGLAVAAIIAFGLIILIVFLSTIYDIWKSLAKTTPNHGVLVAFSMYTNTKKLFSLKSTSSSFSHLNGLKVCGTILIVTLHSIASFSSGPVDNILDFYNWATSYSGQYITEIAVIAVDLFFVMRGFLTAFSFNTARDRGVKFNVVSYYLHRYLRLTPPLAALVLFHSAVINHLSSGPFWKSTNGLLVKPCIRYWWSVIFYAQNYSAKTVCTIQTWFLSVDMQIFLISPLLLLLMRYRKKWGYMCLSVLSAVSIILGFFVSWTYELFGTFSKNMLSQNTESYLALFYFPTYTRVTPYLLGIMLYYVIDKLKNVNANLEKYTTYVVLGWIFSFLILHINFVILIGGFWQKSECGKVVQALCFALERLIWSITVCCTIFACEMGLGGAINRILSLSIFQILSKLCYSIYLTHLTLILATNFFKTTPLHFSGFNVTWALLQHLALSLCIAVMWHLFFEAPFLVIDKMLFKENLQKHQ